MTDSGDRQRLASIETIRGFYDDSIDASQWRSLNFAHRSPEAPENHDTPTIEQMTAARKLLVRGKKLLVDPTLAQALGLNTCIVFGRVAYWVEKNQQAGSQKHFREGGWWTFNSVAKWHRNDFPFWSLNTVQRIFDQLRELNLIATGNFNERRGDKTAWYTINYSAYYAFIKLWSEHQSPQAGDSRPSAAYKAFLADWDKQKQKYAVYPSWVDPLTQVGYDHVPKLGVTHTQVGDDVTSNDPENKQKIPTQKEKERGGISEAQKISEQNKPAPRSEVFAVIADKSFKLKDVTTISDATTDDIDILIKWLNDNYPDATAETLTSFYLWWKRKHPKAFVPKNKSSFANNFSEFAQGYSTDPSEAIAIIDDKRKARLQRKQEADEYSKQQEAILDAKAAYRRQYGG